MEVPSKEDFERSIENINEKLNYICKCLNIPNVYRIVDRDYSVYKICSSLEDAQKHMEKYGYSSYAFKIESWPNEDES